MGKVDVPCREYFASRSACSLVKVKTLASELKTSYLPFDFLQEGIHCAFALWPLGRRWRWHLLWDFRIGTDMHDEPTDPWCDTRRRLRTVVCIFRTSRVLSAPDESLLLSIVSGAFECLQELCISFLCVFLLLPSFSFSLFLLLFALGFALAALCILAELVLINLLWLWFSASVGVECTGE